VPGFEAQGLRVACCSKKLPKTQSWCFVPLIFSALGDVPQPLRHEGVSKREDIEAAQPIWEELFSHWPQWRRALRQVIDTHGQPRFEREFLPLEMNSNSWSTSLVFGEPKSFGRLPHPQGRRQDTILSMLPCDLQNQIFASVMTIASA